MKWCLQIKTCLLHVFLLHNKCAHRGWSHFCLWNVYSEETRCQIYIKHTHTALCPVQADSHQTVKCSVCFVVTEVKWSLKPHDCSWQRGQRPPRTHGAPNWHLLIGKNVTRWNSLQCWDVTLYIFIFLLFWSIFYVSHEFLGNYTVLLNYI